MRHLVWRGAACVVVLGAAVTTGGLLSAAAPPNQPLGLSVAEQHRGATPSSVSVLPAPAGDTVESVTDSQGSFILQTAPAKSESGTQIVSTWDPKTHSLTTWTQGANGFVGQPVTRQSGPSVSITEPTTSSYTKHKSTIQLDAVIIDLCHLYPLGPVPVVSPFGVLLVATSIISCPYPSGIAMTVDLQQFDDWVWYTVTSNGAAQTASEFMDLSADDPCFGYGKGGPYNPWEFNNYSIGSVNFRGSTASGSASAGGAAPCSAYI